MFRLLFILLALTVSLHAAEAVPPAPVPQDFLDYSAWQVTVLMVVGLLLTLPAVVVSILMWAVFVFILVMILKMTGITWQMLLMKLVQRQMMGKGKSLLWQLGILICLPAGIGGLWLAIKIFGIPYQGTSLLIFGVICGALVAVGFIWLSKVTARRMSQRMMGGMGGMNPMQAQMMAEMMKLRGKK
jgi:hypothetical protein